MDVDPGAVAGHLRERRREPRGAAVLQRVHEPALDELEARLDQLVARERVADLHGRPLLAGALAELLARQDAGAADPVAAGRGAEQDDDFAGPARARRASRARSAAARRTSR